LTPSTIHNMSTTPTGAKPNNCKDLQPQ
jgi:hypothetical protein